MLKTGNDWAMLEHNGAPLLETKLESAFNHPQRRVHIFVVGCYKAANNGWGLQYLVHSVSDSHVGQQDCYPLQIDCVRKTVYQARQSSQGIHCKWFECNIPCAVAQTTYMPKATIVATQIHDLRYKHTISNSCHYLCMYICTHFLSNLPVSTNKTDSLWNGNWNF